MSLAHLDRIRNDDTTCFVTFSYIFFMFCLQDHWVPAQEATKLKTMHLTSADGVEDMVGFCMTFNNHIILY